MKNQVFSQADYDDIIHLPHHVSKKHPHMPPGDRAAQFAPFAAVAGHQEKVDETAQQTAESYEETTEAAFELP